MLLSSRLVLNMQIHLEVLYKVAGLLQDSAVVSIVSETFMTMRRKILFQGLVTRHLIATDAWGNQSVWLKKIYILKVSIDNVIWSRYDLYQQIHAYIIKVIPIQVYPSLWPDRATLAITKRYGPIALVCKIALGWTRDEKLETPGVGYASPGLGNVVH